MSGEAPGDLKMPESETAAIAEEQLWDAPEWEEQPESDWATSAEKPVADSEYKQVSALCPCSPMEHHCALHADLSDVPFMITLLHIQASTARPLWLS